MFNLPSDCLSKSHSALLPQCLCCISSRKKFSKLATAAHTQFVEYGHLQKLGTAQKYGSWFRRELFHWRVLNPAIPSLGSLRSWRFVSVGESGKKS